VLLLQQMGEAASDLEAQDVPDYLRGMVMLDKAGWLGRALGGGGKGGLVNALNLHTASPYATLADLGKAAGTVFPGANKYNLREFSSLWNPLIGAAAETVSRMDQPSPKGFGANYLDELVGSIPQVALVRPYPSTLYPNRDFIERLSRLAGSPRVSYDPGEASYQRYLGR